MGYYIAGIAPKGKVNWLVETQDASLVNPRAVTDDFFKELPTDKALVCVVDNGAFEAAGICFSLPELQAFRDDPFDHRLKRWLTLDKAKVLELCPNVASVL